MFVGFLLLVAVLIGNRNRGVIVLALLGLIIVGAILSFLYRWIVRNGLPGLVITGPDGKGAGKCTRCGSNVTFLPRTKGDTAFKCDACGESGTWQ